ncbi:MAG TPA: hypothetical protein VGC77_17465 [Rhodopseudomonas sp.]|uniref:hypothetical protein n=1 Tax=Rhodopseudomonas sp. TaxID=1078 RepID=UPI002ED9E857
MLSAVQFDHQLQPPADEVDDERSDAGLAAEVRAVQRDVAAQPMLQHPLGVGRLRAHSSGELFLRFAHAGS